MNEAVLGLIGIMSAIAVLDLLALRFGRDSREGENWRVM